MKIYKISILLIFLFFINISSATEYYVSPNGNLNGTTLNTPSNLSEIATKVNCGDTIYLLNGTYENEYSILDKNIIENRIKVIPYNRTVKFIGEEINGGVVYNWTYDEHGGNTTFVIFRNDILPFDCGIYVWDMWNDDLEFDYWDVSFSNINILYYDGYYDTQDEYNLNNFWDAVYIDCLIKQAYKNSIGD